jgi:hypothetical protein
MDADLDSVIASEARQSLSSTTEVTEHTEEMHPQIMSLRAQRGNLPIDPDSDPVIPAKLVLDLIEEQESRPLRPISTTKDTESTKKSTKVHWTRIHTDLHGFPLNLRKSAQSADNIILFASKTYDNPSPPTRKSFSGFPSTFAK